MSERPLRVLVVGTGFGCRIQVPALRAAGFDVVGLVGSDAGRTAERATANGVAASFVDLDEAISSTGAEAVAVATPPDAHKALTMAALARGCHVLCEKPFALTVDEATDMRRAAGTAGVVHLLGYEFRFSPDRAMVARVIADGMIGEPVVANFTHLLSYAVSPDTNLPGWWWDKSAGGGWLGASGSHAVDLVRTWLGEVSSVSGSLSAVRAERDDAEDSFSVRLRLASGAEAILQQTAAAWGPPVRVAHVVGTKGTIWLDAGTVQFADRHGTREVPIAADLLLPPAPPASTDPRQQSAEWQWLTRGELGPYARLCEVWRDAIRGGQPSVPAPATFDDGVKAMEILDAIQRSSASGGELVPLPRVART